MKDNYYFGGQVRNAVRPDYHGQVHNKPEPQKIDPGYYWVVPCWDVDAIAIAYCYGRNSADMLDYGETEQSNLLILEKVTGPTRKPTPEEIEKLKEAY